MIPSWCWAEELTPLLFSYRLHFCRYCPVSAKSRFPKYDKFADILSQATILIFSLCSGLNLTLRFSFPLFIHNPPDSTLAMWSSSRLPCKMSLSAVTLSTQCYLHWYTCLLSRKKTTTRSTTEMKVVGVIGSPYFVPVSVWNHSPMIDSVQ